MDWLTCGRLLHMCAGPCNGGRIFGRASERGAREPPPDGPGFGGVVHSFSQQTSNRLLLTHSVRAWALDRAMFAPAGRSMWVLPQISLQPKAGVAVPTVLPQRITLMPSALPLPTAPPLNASLPAPSAPLLRPGTALPTRGLDGDDALLPRMSPHAAHKSKPTAARLVLPQTGGECHRDPSSHRAWMVLARPGERVDGEKNKSARVSAISAIVIMVA